VEISVEGQVQVPYQVCGRYLTQVKAHQKKLIFIAKL
jgi:hypothetical protein